MSHRISTLTLLVALLVLLAACAGPAAQANEPATTAPPAPTAAPTAAPTTAPTTAPTSTPAPTAVPSLASDIYVAGVDVGELTVEQVRAKLERELAPKLGSIEVQAGEAHLTLRPEEIDLELALDEMLAAAQQAEAGARIALRVRYDEAGLWAALEDLAKQVDTPPVVTVITSTASISRSFAISEGRTLDLDAAVQALDQRLQTLGGARRVTLSPQPAVGAAARPTPEQLQQQIEQMAGEWNGIIGVYVYDLASDTVVASLNENSVFSGASVMKVPILLQSYIKLPKFSTKQETWLKKMIVESDNLSANQMLAASANGAGTEDALQGALDMTAMLQGLGLEHTYQYMPYEASDYLINVRKFKIKRGPPQEGPKPYTEADPVLRTTPAEMSRVFLLIHQCSQGKGPLLEQFAELAKRGTLPGDARPPGEERRPQAHGGWFSGRHTGCP